MLNRRFMVPATAALVALTFVACQDGGVAPGEVDAPEVRKSSGGSSAADAADAALLALGDEINARLAEDGAGYRLGMVEWLAGPGSEEAGRTVFFSNVGNKQLPFQFVPGDTRRAWSGPVGPGDDITWATDLTQGDAGPGLAPTQTAIGNAMATWDGAACSTLPLTLVPAAGDIGFLEFLISDEVGGSPVIAADVVHGGFGTIVDLILPPPAIAATFTFIFAGPTDIDNDGNPDAALREIYYTFNFPWGINTNFPIDVETVALHETGHGLSQGHYGKLFGTDSNGKFHFAPLAVMNAGYTGIQQSLAGTDGGGHCSMWAQWPNN